MDCQTVRQWIDLHPRTSRDWECAEGAEVRDHVAGCELCRHAVDDAQEFDGRVKSLLDDVAIPAGCETGFWLRSSFPPREWSLQGGPPENGSVGWSDSDCRSCWPWGVGTGPRGLTSMTLAKLGDSAATVLLVRSRLRWRSTAALLLRSPILAWQRVAAPSLWAGIWMDDRATMWLRFRVNIASLRFRGWLVVIRFHASAMHRLTPIPFD